MDLRARSEGRRQIGGRARPRTGDARLLGLCLPLDGNGMDGWMQHSPTHATQGSLEFDLSDLDPDATKDLMPLRPFPGCCRGSRIWAGSGPFLNGSIVSFSTLC
jgi:hypothetical protein